MALCNELYQCIITSCDDSLTHLCFDEIEFLDFPSTLDCSLLFSAFPHLQSLQLAADNCNLLTKPPAMFQDTLHTLILPNREETMPLLLTMFPALHTITVFVTDYDQILTPYPAMTQITSLSLTTDQSLRSKINHEIKQPSQQQQQRKNNVDIPPVDRKMLTFAAYTALQSLSLKDTYLYPMELSSILTLPKLHSLELDSIGAKHDMILFSPHTYPSSQLAPLHSLSFTGEVIIRFTEYKLRTLLMRFPSLETLQLSDTRCKLPEKIWKEVKAEYRYRLLTAWP